MGMLIRILSVLATLTELAQKPFAEVEHAYSVASDGLKSDERVGN